VLKKRIADRLDARYGRRSALQRLDTRVAALDQRLAQLERALTRDPSLRRGEASTTGDVKGELLLLRHQVAELARLLDKP
jgi:uncharacterized protein YceH (UPF0502 family)